MTYNPNTDPYRVGTQKLKPCPLCGQKIENVSPAILPQEGDYSKLTVYCTFCNLHLKIRTMNQNPEDYIDTAVIAWNMRDGKPDINSYP